MQFLLPEISSIPEVNKTINQNHRFLITGVEGSLKSFLIGAMHKEKTGPTLIITSDNAKAEKIYADLIEIFPEVEIFPGENLLYFSEMLSRSEEISNARIKVLQRLAFSEKVIVIAPLSSLLPRLLPPSLWRGKSLVVKQNQEINLDATITHLIDLGYRRVSVVENPGQVSLKGGILDIFTSNESFPVRIELFGDEVESLRLFDPVTQRSKEKIKEVAIIPAREFFLNPSLALKGGEKIFAEAQQAAERLKMEGNPLGAEHLQERATEMLNKLKEDYTFPGAEQYFAHFYGEGSSLLDYVSKKGHVILDEPLRIEEGYRDLISQLRDTETSLLLQGDILPSQTKYYWDLSLLLEKYDGYLRGVSLFSRKSRYFTPDLTLSIESQTLPRYREQWEMLLTEINDWKEKKYRIIFCLPREEEALNLKNILDEKKLAPLYLKEVISSAALPKGTPVITIGNASNGFVLPREKLVLITEKELLERTKISKVRPKRKEKKFQLRDYRDIKVGDFVVHEQHGIGSYQGIRTLEIGDVQKDYLFIKYKGTDKLFIPTDQIEVIQKYVGVEGKSPKLSTLGGQEWIKTKSKVIESVEELARELLSLYSEREASKGYAFSPDQAWQAEFEDRFPYRETPDQLRAVDEVKKDMEKEKVMDRLVCGDVGYGKTEVALRAAFKAILDGRQVAFLVPTTILAQQHYRNFLERFKGDPVTVDVLSRFRTPSQQKETLKNIKEGKVDLVIGTHRLLTGDIKFKDLGLLIVDEEQRFGVKHKEKLKMLKKNVDVLTLTATPIPRTLHMSLVGARDLSVIETPPEERYPIQTYVVEYNDYLLKEAVLREVRRGGQVYFVYNRVKNITQWVQRLQKLLPEVRIGMGHGQMSESRLEKVMFEFLEKKYDILISTTIVEAGLDLPNVNTIIIYDADKLGLSQLYQLRGRVGRSNRVAYCYLTYQKDKILTEVAEKRLQAIKEFTELGSGFKIALRDLEIRGAGNILGPQQHGFVASVGFDLYCKLLQNTIKTIKGKKVEKEKPETRVELNINAFIPTSYIPDQEQKIECYQKIAAAEGGAVEEIQAEMRDRYGPLPPPVENLFRVVILKQLSLESGVNTITEDGGVVKITFLPYHRLDSNRLWELTKTKKGRLKISVGIGYTFRVIRQGLTEEMLLEFLLELLGDVKSLAK